jgi:hypothetical protein
MFMSYGRRFGVDLHIIEIAWSYAVRFTKNWALSPKYMFACLSLAYKTHASLDETDMFISKIHHFFDYGVLGDLEIEVAQALNWELYNHELSEETVQLGDIVCVSGFNCHCAYA